MSSSSSCRSRARARFIRLWAWALGLTLIALTTPANAISVHAVYRSACDRNVGIIIDVESRELTLLGLDGVVRRIPRYEVVSIAYYPVSGIDIDPTRVHQAQPAMRVETMLNGELVPLLDGWPVDFNQERIAFLNIQGQEIIVSRERIWAIEYLESMPLVARPPRGGALSFVHPHAVGFCNDEVVGANARKLFPQQFINDQVVIKRELDRLMEGHQDIHEYHRDQVFYPKPQLYTNQTELGLWTSHGHKHGASPSRPNNFTPVLVDELSLGPFGYQHRLVTGSAPMPYSVHTETQTQIYYRFKAAYFHASAMFDPNLLLVGEEYQWSRDDLVASRPDARLNEVLMVELGFDWGPLALQISPGALALAGARTAEVFTTSERGLFRFGPRFTFHFWSAELFLGVSDRNQREPIRWLRLNGELTATERLRFSASLLWRSIEMRAFDEEAATPEQWLVVDRAYAASAEASYTLWRRYDVALRVSAESAHTEAASTAGEVRRGTGFDLALGWYVGLRF